jgi:hypothetical protein
MLFRLMRRLEKFAEYSGKYSENIKRSLACKGSRR